MMKFLGTFFAILIGIFTLSLSDSALAKKKARAKTVVSTPIYGTQNLIAEINRILNSADPNARVGIQIKSMKNGDILYSRNERSQFVPASILKIVTAQTALLFLGPDYKFQTKLMTDANHINNNGIIDGNVYLIFSGDPTLTYYDMTDLMEVLKSQQIQRVNGSLYIDESAYDQEIYGPGWLWNDKRFCYAAPISASIINRNCISFGLLPGKFSGTRANIIESPRYYYSAIQNAVVTKSTSSRSCYIRLTNNADGSIAVEGCMPKGGSAQGITTVITDVSAYSQSMMRDLFRRSGIQVTGSVGKSAALGKLQLIATHESKPLHELVNEMLKMSDNIIAGSLFKKIGSVYTRKPGSWGNGSSAVSQILSQKMGVDVSRSNILDGSGLSRYNQISPAQLMKILDFGYHNYSTNYEFISALPIAGVDGTLKHRLGNVAWKVRAKTGTISGVVSLAGYAVNKDKEPIAFVIIVNGRKGMGWKYRELEDKIVTAITKYSRG